MEIPAWMYFSFWFMIGVFSLYIAMEVLGNTDSPTSVSPAILFPLKLFFAAAACHSATHALVFRSKMKIRTQTYYLWFAFAIFPLGFAATAADKSFAWYFPIYSAANTSVVIFYFLPWAERFVGPVFFYFQSVAVALFPLLYFLSPGDPFAWYFSIFLSNIIVIYHAHFAAVGEQQFALLFHYSFMCVLFILCGGMHIPYLMFSVLFSSFFTLAAHASVTGDEAIREIRVFSKARKMMEKNGRVMDFSIGMASAILCQRFFFRLTSADQAVALLLLAVAWLANLALLLCPHDCGIFSFLVGNVVVGCAAGQFRFLGSDWVAYGACICVYILRLKVEVVSFVDRGEEKAAVVAWGENRAHLFSPSQ